MNLLGNEGIKQHKAEKISAKIMILGLISGCPYDNAIKKCPYEKINKWRELDFSDALKEIEKTPNQELETIYDEHKHCLEQLSLGKYILNDGYVVEKALFVDDEKILKLTYKAMFQQRFKTYFASNGVEALEALEQDDNISYLVTDLNMPKMNGHELVEKVLEKNPDFKIIISSGSIEDEDKLYKNKRNVFYVDKPTGMRDFEKVFDELKYLDRDNK